MQAEFLRKFDQFEIDFSSIKIWAAQAIVDLRIFTLYFSAPTAKKKNVCLYEGKFSVLK